MTKPNGWNGRNGAGGQKLLGHIYIYDEPLLFVFEANHTLSWFIRKGKVVYKGTQPLFASMVKENSMYLLVVLIYLILYTIEHEMFRCPKKTVSIA